MLEPSRIRNPAQRQMHARMNFLLSLIEGVGSQGIEQDDLERVMLVNGYGTVRLTRSYLQALEGFGKVVRREGKLYLTSYSPGALAKQTTLQGE